MLSSSTGKNIGLQDEIRTLRERIRLLESKASEHQHTITLLEDSEGKSRAWLDHSPVCTKIVVLNLNSQYMSKASN